MLSALATDLHGISIQASPGFVLQVIPLFKTCTRLNPGREAELQFLLWSLGFGGLHILWVAFIKNHKFWYSCAPPTVWMYPCLQYLGAQPWALPAAGCQDCRGVLAASWLLDLLSCRSLLLLLQWHFCVCLWGLKTPYVWKQIVQVISRCLKKQLMHCTAQIASKCNILVFAMPWKGRFLLGLGAFWRERSFLLTHSVK